QTARQPATAATHFKARRAVGFREVDVNTIGRSPGAASGTLARQLLEWAPILLGLCVLYVPTLVGLFTGPWAQDDQYHGPIVLAISLWLLHRNWQAMEAAAEGRKGNPFGWVLVVFGLFLYAIGRSQ